MAVDSGAEWDGKIDRCEREGVLMAEKHGRVGVRGVEDGFF